MSPSLPIIDFPTPSLADPAHLRAVGTAIGEACRTVGFFYLRGHGLAPEFPALFEASRAFFALPAVEKERIAILATSDNRGYVGLDTEALDPDAPVDRKEALNIRLDPDATDPGGVDFWPKMTGFRERMTRYFIDVYRLGLLTHRAIALDLGVPFDWFDPILKHPMATLRLLHYPPAVDASGRLGAGAHTDYGNLTILLTDEVGGLEVQRLDGEWISAPHVPGAYICNIGDCLMRWTNDVYVSTPHRVVAPRDRDRYSIAFFLDANADAMVAPLPTCVSPDRPARYEPMTTRDYLRSRFTATYGF